MEDLKSKLRAFVIDTFLFGDDSGLEDQTSFLESGIIDSMGILELVDFIDKEFKVVIADEELLPENLDSINNIVGYLKMKMGYEAAC